MPTYANTVPVMERHRFDVASLDRYLRANLAGYRGGLEVRQFDSGHSNPTFFLSAEMAGGERKDFVLRKKPPGKLVASAHQVDREFRVISALAATDVPVAPAHLLCADDSVIGQMFYIMSCVEGRILVDPSMPDQTPAERAAIFDSMNDVLARLHKVDPAKVGLGDYGRTGQYIARQVSRWTRQYAELKTEDIAAMDKLAAFLPANIPGRGPDHHRPRRLSSGQPDRPSDRAAHRRGARLGAVDARPSVVRPRLQLHRLPPEGAAARLRRGRLQEARPADRGANTSPPTAAGRGATASITGTTTSPSRSSASPPSRRASTGAGWRATRPIRIR